MNVSERVQDRMLWCVAVILTVAGCSALTVPDAPPASSPVAPVWDEGEIRGHLSFLHADVVRGRSDATIGYTIAAAYAADRMEEYRLQPVLESDFRILYPAERNVVSGARLEFAAADSTRFVLGRDFLPSGRTAPYDGLVRTIWIGNIAGAAGESGSALLWFGEPDGRAATQMQQGDVDLLWVQGALEPHRYATRLPMSVVQITPKAMRRILLQSRADPENPSRRLLRRALRLQVASSWSRTAAAINVVGYVPGKHPEHSDEAVVLTTHLDATGNFAGVPALDTRNFGVEVAAVLETARQLSRFSRLTRIPERTLIVALVSGGTVDSSGLRDLLKSPVWARENIRKVIYVGHAPGLADAVPSGLSIRTVTIPPSPALPDSVFLLPAEPGATAEGSRPSADDFIGPATEAAVELASRVYVALAAELMAHESELASR